MDMTRSEAYTGTHCGHPLVYVGISLLGICYDSNIIQIQINGTHCPDFYSPKLTMQLHVANFVNWLSYINT